MQFETRRVMPKSGSDHPVLPAADIRQTIPAADVVTDLFRTVGKADNVIGVPTVDDTGMPELSKCAQKFMWIRSIFA
jgi:hypothetical protein